MKKVVVGMSGGVDSSVAALLLKEAGYHVIGITLKLSSIEACSSDIQVCCSPQDVKDAKKVATYLGIEHYTIDWEDLFKEKVIRPFLEGYKKGLTPNPCSICNREVKTGKLAKYAKVVFGADFFSTGHYIRKVDYKGYPLLARGKDPKKDQSYFMALVEPDIIPILLFPLGEKTKEEVRRIAAEHNLPVSSKKDSFEICFTAGKTPGEYIRQVNAFNVEGGDIITTSGQKVGKHTGLVDYTIGQRRGIGVSLGKPVYVIDKDINKNQLIVGSKDELLTDTAKAKNFNFHLPINLWEKDLYVQGRYKQKPIKIKDFSYKDGILTVQFEEPQLKFAPGQILAVYKDDILLGGGEII